MPRKTRRPVLQPVEPSGFNEAAARCRGKRVCVTNLYAVLTTLQ